MAQDAFNVHDDVSSSLLDNTGCDEFVSRMALAHSQMQQRQRTMQTLLTSHLPSLMKIRRLRALATLETSIQQRQKMRG